MEYTIRFVETDKKKIYIDPQETEGIFLYPAEIKREGLKDGGSIEAERLERLRKEYGIKRAKKRAVSLVAKKDMTEYDLRGKLEKSLNDPISIDGAIAFMKSMGYIDDLRYARDYFSSKKQKKSFAIMKQELRNKGISSGVIETVTEEYGGQDVSDLIPLMKKYLRKFDDIDVIARQKTLAHFCRKGYTTDLVKRAYRDVTEYRTE